MGSFKTESILYDAITPSLRIRQISEKYLGNSGKYIGITAGLISLPITAPIAVLYSGIRKLKTEKPSIRKRRNKSGLENGLSN